MIVTYFSETCLHRGLQDDCSHSHTAENIREDAFGIPPSNAYTQGDSEPSSC